MGDSARPAFHQHALERLIGDGVQRLGLSAKRRTISKQTAMLLP
jgi:hypothetical protein